MKRLSYIR